MRRLRFPIAVAITSFALVTVMGAVAVLTLPFGAALARTALASGLGAGGPWLGHPGFGGSGVKLPPEFEGLGDLPPAERFAHFVGVQVNLKDKDGRPLTVNIIPGAVAEVSASSVTIAANDGTVKTFTLSDETVIPGQAGAQELSLGNGDSVVVITLNNGTTARAVVNVGKNGFGPGGFGPPPWVGSALRHR